MRVDDSSHPIGSRPSAWLILFVMMALFSGCMRTHLFYDSRDIRYEKFRAKDKARLAKALSEKLRDRVVERVDASGARKTILLTPGSLSQLELAELGALWVAIETGERGGESDLRVRTSKGSIPVQVLVDLDGNIVFHSGGAKARDDDGPLLSEDAIRKKYGLEYPLPGRWDEEERRALALSLSLLSPQELAVVQGLTFARQAKSRTGGRNQAALYVLNGCKASISVFTNAVRSDRYRFVGEPTAPRSAVLHSLLHEMGHAFDAAAAREAYCKSLRGPPRQRAADIERGNTLARESTVLRTFLDVRAGTPGPTEYANTSPKEAFAEAFALFHSDPAALRRAMPAVYAWFARGGHLDAARADGMR